MLNKILLALLLVSLIQATPEFEAWRIKQSKSYTSDEEYNYRLAVWLDNMVEIEAHNFEGKHSFRKGANKFTDMTKEEFR